MSEKDIDAFVDSKIKEYGASATYKTDEVNFPGVICISTNDEIVHSPASDYVFQKGDVVSFDLVITYKDMKTDSAFTMVVDDEPKGAVKHLLSTTERSLYAGIDAIKGVVYTGDIAAAIEKVLKERQTWHYSRASRAWRRAENAYAARCAKLWTQTYRCFVEAGRHDCN